MPLFSKKPKVVPIQIRVINSTALRMDQWRSSPELVTYAQRLFATPEFQTLVGVLRSESPSNYGLNIGATHDDQIAHSYKAAGYNLCLNNLDAFARIETHSEPIEATFEPEPPRTKPT